MGRCKYLKTGTLLFYVVNTFATDLLASQWATVSSAPPLNQGPLVLIQVIDIRFTF